MPDWQGEAVSVFRRENGHMPLLFRLKAQADKGVFSMMQ